MLRRFSFLLLVLFLIIFASNAVFAVDVVMNLNDNTASTPEVSNDVVDGTVDTDTETQFTAPITTTTDYEDPAELSISNMINIILIAVGVVLILLGIAIIIKLK